MTASDASRIAWPGVYVALIVGVNIGFSAVPMVPTPWGDMFPPMSFAVGLVFIARDFAQRAIGHYVLAAMALAAALSWWMAAPVVAVASLAAFAVSELADWGVYSATRRPLRDRVLISSAISTPIDGLIFLSMIGQMTATGFVAMTIAKMTTAIAIWRCMR